MPSSASSSAARLQKLKAFRQGLVDTFQTSNSFAQKWLVSHGKKLDDLQLFSRAAVTATSLAGAVIMNQPVPTQELATVSPSSTATQIAELTPTDQLLVKITAEEQQAIIDKLKTIVQMPAGHLQRQDELYLEQQLTDLLGFEVTAELEGHRLNHSIGIMGGEQHLKRFPTDTLEQHDAAREAGMAPNRGAFGWFTENGELTPTAIEREKYYFAVQTLYLPDWNTDHAELKPWYKFRKMIVINPADNVAVVGVVGDAGPAQWVKKQFGGSPEIIREGKIWSRQARGHVILLFVDDPNNEVPLGPIDLAQNLEASTSTLLTQSQQ